MRALDINDIYHELTRDLIFRGKLIVTRGLVTNELVNVELELANPRARFVTHQTRKMSMKYFVGELCFYLSGSTSLNFIAHYGPFWKQVSDDGATVNSAYGARMFGRPGTHMLSHPTPFWYAMDLLIADMHSRKAVVPIYAAEDSRPSKDNPCTMHMQFLIRDNRLDLHVFMRSNDVWLGVPYDVAFFTIAQEIAWVHLRARYPYLELGSYFHHAMSLHVYAEHLTGIANIAAQPRATSLEAPPIVQEDLTSWFDDLRTYEMSKRGVVLYKSESKRTAFQDWCKSWLD